VRPLRALYLLIFLLTASGASFAWGCSGHQTIALIAQAQLNSHARQRITELLAQAPIDRALRRFCGPTTLGAMADVSTWADDYRETDRSTGPWHYWDIPLAQKSAPADRYCDQGCVTKAIRDNLAVLRDTSATDSVKARALMFVIHFVGDLHQPLHAEDNNDMGGNCIPVAFFGTAPQPNRNHPEQEGYYPNLHGAWDTGLPEKIANIRKDNHDADVSAFADSLARSFAGPMRRWKRSPVDVHAWAIESHQLAIRNAYGKLPAKVPVERQAAPVENCSQNNHESQRMMQLHERIAERYLDANRVVIREQLAKAGARLAAALNQVWPAESQAR
jgi:hypothetical protein